LFSGPITASIMLVVAVVVESEKMSGYDGPDDMTFFAKFHKNLGVCWHVTRMTITCTPINMLLP